MEVSLAWSKYVTFPPFSEGKKRGERCMVTLSPSCGAAVDFAILHEGAEIEGQCMSLGFALWAEDKAPHLRGKSLSSPCLTACHCLCIWLSLNDLQITVVSCKIGLIYGWQLVADAHIGVHVGGRVCEDQARAILSLLSTDIAMLTTKLNKTP